VKKVLLATLGETPVVVTEAIDRLKIDGIRIDYVVILTTKDTDAQDALALLSEHIPVYYNNEVCLFDARVLDTFYDVDTDEAALEFMKQTCAALRDYRKKNWEIYTCIAGGRKVMSALLALAVQFYGANMLFHILVSDPEIEEKGNISKLKNIPTEHHNRIFHPHIDKIKIIRMPFVGLFPLLDDLLSALNEKPERPEMQKLLEQNNLWEGGRITELGRRILEILESVETLPPPRQTEECEKNLAHKEPKEARATQDWADKICRRFLFVKRIEDIGWRQGEPKVRQELPNRLIVYLPGRRISGIGFRLTTTAQTDGQLKRAAQEVERWIVKEIDL
jgi:CRISPR-associated protein Csx14